MKAIKRRWSNKETCYLNFDIVAKKQFVDLLDETFEDIYDMADSLKEDIQFYINSINVRDKTVYTADFLSKVNWLEIAENYTDLIIDRSGLL